MKAKGDASGRKLCPSCGATLEGAAAMGDLCPACLLDQGKHSGRQFSEIDERWVSQRFPQLRKAKRLEEPMGSGDSEKLRFGAECCETDHPVILHLFKAGWPGSSERRRVWAKLERLHGLTHPRIAAMRDFGEIDDLLYAIEDAPRGRTLRDAIAEAAVDRSEMLTLLPAISDVMRFASERGVSVAGNPDSVFIAGDGITLSSLEWHSAEPGAGALEWVEQHPAVGTRIGPYHLVGLLGEGGFAEVYRAEQAHPVQREVALKILKLGMDTRQVLARFAREREALARMSHGGIAKIFDAGATESGRPYIAMELVEGEPITAYCDRNALNLEQRAALFGAVCHAVEHGHAKGIVHRDLKPSNVLVTEENGSPVPKVIDYGIARAAEEPWAANTFFTRTQQMIGSPSYMSPEQVGGSVEADERSDVYSLGSLLYNLLTGEPPLTEQVIGDRAVKEIIEAIESRRPEHPSDRVGGYSSERQCEVAANRGLEVEQLGAAMKGALSSIALKALAKRPANRYPDAAALADDVEAFIAERPVSAPRKLRRSQRRCFAVACGVTVTAAALWIATIANSNSGKQSPAASPELGVGNLGGGEEDISPEPAIYVERSRAADGTVSPVALFQFDGDLRSGVENGPDLIAWGEPPLSFEQAEIAGRQAEVMKFPRFLPSQWLKFPNVIGPNGPPGAEETNSWTLVYDVMFPSIPGSIALFQCHSENFGDAEMYVGPQGIGSRFGLYYGEIEPGKWYRIAIVSSHNNRAQLYTSYVNGTRWGMSWVKGMLDAGYAFDDEILLFCEGDQHTGGGYVNSVAMYDVPLSDLELRSLGAPTAVGIPETLTPQLEAGEGELLFAGRLVPEDVRRNDRFGWAVAAEGDEVWCAAVFGDSVANNGGLIYRYRRDTGGDGDWLLRDSIPPPLPEPSLAFGATLLMRPEFAVVGAPFRHSGRAFLLARNATTGEVSAPLRLDPGGLRDGAAFGNAVAVAGNPKAIAVGAPKLGAGKVFLFDPFSGKAGGEIQAPAGAPQGFGDRLAGRGEFLAVGARPEGEGGTTYVFRQAVGGRTHEWVDGVELDNDGAPQPAGTVAFSPGGDLLAVAAPAGYEDPAVSVYRRNAAGSGSNAWQQITCIVPPPGNPDSSFGRALAWLPENRLAIGSPLASWRGRKTGVVHLYGGGDDGWSLQRTIVPRQGSQDGEFGFSLALAGEGRDILWVGADRDQRDRPEGGALFHVRLPRFEHQHFPTASPNFKFGSDVAIRDGIAVVGAPGIDNRVHGGIAQRFELDRENGQWREQPFYRDENPHPSGSFAMVDVWGGRVAGNFGHAVRVFSKREGESQYSHVNAEHPGSLPYDLAFLRRDRLAVAWQDKLEILGIAEDGLAVLESYTGTHYQQQLAADGDRLVHGISSVLNLYQPRSEGGSLALAGTLHAPGGSAEPYFGFGVSLSGDWLLVGSPARNATEHGIGSGRAHFYRFEGNRSAAMPRVVSTQGPPADALDDHPSFGTSVAIDGDIALIGNPLVAKGREPGRVEVYRFDAPQDRWLHAESLQASNASPGDEFGIHVALDDGWAIIGAKSSWVYFYRID